MVLSLSLCSSTKQGQANRRTRKTRVFANGRARLPRRTGVREIPRVAGHTRFDGAHWNTRAVSISTFRRQESARAQWPGALADYRQIIVVQIGYRNPFGRPRAKLSRSRASFSSDPVDVRRRAPGERRRPTLARVKMCFCARFPTRRPQIETDEMSAKDEHESKANGSPTIPRAIEIHLRHRNDFVIRARASPLATAPVNRRLSECNIIIIGAVFSIPSRD